MFGTSGSNTLHADGSSTLRRSSSMRRAQGVAAAGAKRRSIPLQVKYTVVSIFKAQYILFFVMLIFVSDFILYASFPIFLAIKELFLKIKKS